MTIQDHDQGKDKTAIEPGRARAVWKYGLQNRADAWWQTVTQHTPEPWLIARRAADARRLRLMMIGAH